MIFSYVHVTAMVTALSVTLFHVATCAHKAKDIVTLAGPKTALVVVDAQVGILGSVWDSNRIVGNIESLVRKARGSGTPIIWVQHSDQELKYGSDAWKIAPNFKPESAEPIIHKRYNSSFAGTDIDLKLKQLGVKRLVVAGAATNWCIRATAYAAMDRGYDLVVVSDGHSTEHLEPRQDKLILANDIIEEFNAVMRWISFPNIRVEVKSTAEVEF